jgi:hypothetical protein
MNSETSRDAIVDRVAALPRLRPAAATSARIRTRAHVALERPRRRQATPRHSFSAVAINAMLVVVSGVYLAGAVGEALRLFAGLSRAAH